MYSLLNSVDGNLQILERDNRVVFAQTALTAGMQLLQGRRSHAIKSVMEGFKAMSNGGSGGSGGAVASEKVDDHTTVADVILFSGCMDTQTSADAHIGGM
jgi:hypothetical protein